MMAFLLPSDLPSRNVARFLNRIKSTQTDYTKKKEQSIPVPIIVYPLNESAKRIIAEELSDFSLCVFRVESIRYACDWRKSPMNNNPYLIAHSARRIQDRLKSKAISRS